MVECSKHLNTKNSIEQKKKQQEDRDTPDLFSGSPKKHNEELYFVHIYIYIYIYTYIEVRSY